MSDDLEFDHVTTESFVATYNASKPVFAGIFREIRELSKKRPDATMSASKVKVVNRLLNDLLLFLKDEPSGKYLEPLDDQSLPQVSDAVLAMVQFESALKSFQVRYYRRVRGTHYWITEELIARWNEGDEPSEDDDDLELDDDL